MNRYNLALFLLTIAVVPLFYVSGWLGVLAVVAIYYLLARLANKDLDRQPRRGGDLHADVLKRRAEPAGNDVRRTRKHTLR